MRSLAILALFLAGCDPLSLATKPTTKEEARPSADALTPDQLQAWQRLRKQPHKPAFANFAYDVLRREWQLRGHVNLRPHDSEVCGWKDGKEIPITFAQWAEERAAANAAEPSVKVVAVVSVYRPEEPMPVKWLADKGSGLRVYTASPYPEHGAALAKALRAMQRDLLR